MDDYKKETIGLYNREAGHLTKRFAERMPLQSLSLEQFVRQLAGPKVLDIGCGPGFHLEFFREQGLDALGIDLSDSFLEICASKGLNVRKMDLEDPLLYPYSFDGIWAVASLLHVPREKVPAVLAKWAKLLKPNGIMYVAVKQGEGEAVESGEAHSELKRYCTYFSSPELKSFLAPRFEILDESEVEGPEGTRWLNFLVKVKPEVRTKLRNF